MDKYAFDFFVLVWFVITGCYTNQTGSQLPLLEIRETTEEEEEEESRIHELTYFRTAWSSIYGNLRVFDQFNEIDHLSAIFFVIQKSIHC